MTDVKSQPWPADTRRVRLGEIEIDPRYRRVRRGDAEYELNPRCFELLQLFLREPRSLHTRDAIFRKVWRGAIVEDANLTTSIWLLRRALGGSAKQWIRTVSRQGYVFDPPVPIELELLGDEEAEIAAPREPEPAARADTLATSEPTPTPAAVAARPLPAITRGWALALSAAAACLSLLLLTGAVFGPSASPAAMRQVVLIAPANTGLPSSASWPSRLLHHWLDWQLRSAPQLQLRHSAIDSERETLALLDVSAPVQDEQWTVAVRFRGAAAPPDIVRRSDMAGLVDTVEQVSAAAVSALVGITANTTPASTDIGLDTALAVRLVDGLEAESEHRWNDAAQAYGRVVATLPDAGFARFRLARSLGRLGQQSGAQIELGRAMAWINSLPAHLHAPIQAEALLLRQDYTAAAQAYAALARMGGGERAHYRVAEASSLRQDGRSGDATLRLDGELPGVPDQAVAWLLEQTRTALANRDFRNAGRHAERALKLTRALGWQNESAVAALLLADVQALTTTAAPELFAQAEHDFTAAGNRLGALGAKLRSELHQSRGASNKTLEGLLAEASSAGNAAAEIDALRRSAVAAFGTGDTRAAHRYFAQAEAVAESSGHNAEQRRIGLPLLGLDTLRLDFAALEKRLARFAGEPQQGQTAFMVGLARARLHYLRGQFDDALRTLDQTEAQMRETSNATNLPQGAASLSCLRGIIHTALGHTADSRTEFRNCRNDGQAKPDHSADLGDAALAIQAGDLAEARRLLALTQADQESPSPPQRWAFVADIVPLLARSGDLDRAEVLIDEVFDAVLDSGYPMIEAILRLTRAEIALAESRPADAEREVARAEKLLPADYWQEQRRARTVRALLAQTQGRSQVAARALDTLHEDARTHGDVLGELLVHSLMEANPQTTRCSEERRLRLLATSGLRGASDLWMSPAGRDKAHIAAATTHTSVTGRPD